MFLLNKKLLTNPVILNAYYGSGPSKIFLLLVLILLI